MILREQVRFNLLSVKKQRKPCLTHDIIHTNSVFSHYLSVFGYGLLFGCRWNHQMIIWVVKLTANLLQGHWFPAHQRPSFHQNTYISSCPTSFFPCSSTPPTCVTHSLYRTRTCQTSGQTNMWWHCLYLCSGAREKLHSPMCVQHVRPKSTSTSNYSLDITCYWD